MNDVIRLPLGKLDDPLVAEWALRRYEKTHNTDPELARRMEEAWFDDLTLQRWVDSDEKELLTSLFHVLPEELFANLHGSIVEKWPQWQSALASQSARAVVREDPETALRLFSNHLSEDFSDLNKTHAVIELLPELAAKDALELLEKITASLIGHNEHDFERAFLLGAVLPVIADMQPEALADVFFACLEIGDNETLEDDLNALSRALFGSTDLLVHVTMFLQDKSIQTCRSLGLLFEDGAPLAECDEILGSSELLPPALELLDAHRSRSLGSQTALTLIQQAQASLDPSLHHDLACFAVASVLHAFERSDVDTGAMAIEELVTLLSADLPGHRQASGLVEELRARDRSEVAAAIDDRMPAVRDEYGEIHLAWAVGELELVELVPMLRDCLGRNRGDLLCEAASSALCRFGQIGLRAIVEAWSELDPSQRIFGASVIRDVGGPDAADFAAENFEALFPEDSETWCELALASPDQRLAQLLEGQLHRRQAGIDRTFYLLSVLTDRAHEDLEAIRERIQHDRQRRQRRREAIASGQPFFETISLALRCPLCGDQNSYEVCRVLLSEEPSDYPHLLVDEFPCVSCDAWANFEFSAEASMTLLAELVRMQANASLGKGLRGGPVQLLSLHYQWRERPAAEVIAELEREIAEHPHSERDQVVLGRANYVLGRHRRARQCWQAVYDRDPRVMEAGLGIAQVMVRSDAPEEAYELLTDVLARQEQWRFLRAGELPPAELGAEFADLFNRLHRGLEIQDRPLLHASFMRQQSKVGRNGPCPCGSGRKFKKCCSLSSGR